MIVILMTGQTTLVSLRWHLNIVIVLRLLLPYLQQFIWITQQIKFDTNQDYFASRI
jgi:hypothetical protein